MKSSDILRAFSDADTGFVEQAADENGKAYQPDISAVLDAIRSGDAYVPDKPLRAKDGKISRIMLWICGAAACAVIAFTAVMFANRDSDLREPENSVGGSLPVEVVTDTTTAVQVERDIAFWESYAFRNIMEPEEEDALRSCVIRSVDELKANRVQPSKVYTEDYFKDHALIFVTTVFSCTGEAPDVTCVHVSGNSIEVIARRSEAHDEGRQWWCTFLEVSLSDLPAGDSEVTLHSYHTISHDDEPEQTEIVTGMENNPGEITYTVVEADHQHYSGKLSMEQLNELEPCLIRSMDELKKIVIQPAKQYSESFFIDHALVFVTKVFARISDTRVTEVRPFYGVMDVYAEREFDGEQTDNWWCCFIEVDRRYADLTDSVTLWADNPRELEPPTPKTDRKVTFEEARIPNLSNIAGSWTGYPGAINLYVSEGKDGCTFEYSKDDDSPISGKVTVENGEYVFRSNTNDVLRMVPDENDPLNTLVLTDGYNEIEFKRWPGDAIPYDRQCVEVREEDFTGTPLKEALGGHWVSGESYGLMIYDCSALKGSFRISYSEYVDSSGTAGDYFSVYGTVKVEEGRNNKGEKHYYYNFYNEQSQLIMTMDGDENGYWCDYTIFGEMRSFHHFEQGQPFSFILRLDEEYDRELRIEKGVEWDLTSDDEFFGTELINRQSEGWQYASEQYLDYDMLWFKMQLTNERPEVRSVTIGKNGKITVEAAMIPADMLPGVYSVCVPVPHTSASLTEGTTSDWELKTFSDAAESGKLPQIICEKKP